MKHQRKKQLEKMFEHPETKISKCKGTKITMKLHGKVEKFDLEDIGYRKKKAFYCLDYEIDKENKILNIPYTKKERKAALEKGKERVIAYPHHFKQLRRYFEEHRKEIFLQTGISFGDVNSLLTILQGMELSEYESEPDEKITELVPDA